MTTAELGARAPRSRPGLRAIGPIALLTATRLLRRRRVVFLAILCAVPGMISAIIRHEAGEGGREVFSIFAPIAFLFLLAPIVNVFQTAGIFADEVDDRTLGYLLVRPIAREYILFGKALGAWFVGSVTLGAAALVAHLPFLWRGDLASLFDGARLAPLAGFAALLSISSLIYVGYALIAGILLKRPVLWSLGYAMIVEVAFAIFLDGPPARLAVSHHVSRLLPEAYRSPQEVLAAERLATLSETQPVAVLAGLGALTLAVYATAVFAVRRSEFPVKDD